MMTELDFDPALFGGFSPEVPVYDGLRRWERGELPEVDAGLDALAGRALLEVKSGAASSPVDELSGMLSAMTRELREQLQAFYRMREASETALKAARDEGGDVDRKQQQADAKASIEAMSVIVRTLEKIDSLQRTIAHDRERQAEAAIDEGGYADFVARFEKILAERIAEGVQIERAKWERDARAAGEPSAGQSENPQTASGPG